MSLRSTTPNRTSSRTVHPSASARNILRSRRAAGTRPSIAEHIRTNPNATDLKKPEKTRKKLNVFINDLQRMAEDRVQRGPEKMISRKPEFSQFLLPSERLLTAHPQTSSCNEESEKPRDQRTRLRDD
ncbi:MAG: hypothetical protein OXT70_11020 [Chloroflexota bacterium]|nr:hypothetical protein [Chloroflexota bacterium]